jgi:hypothetical protein
MAHAVRFLVVTSVLGLSACGHDILMPVATEGSPAYTNQLTGEPCDPDPQTLAPLLPSEDDEEADSGPERSNGRGDNHDDPNSGKTDCAGDGNSGGGNDTENCEAPSDEDSGDGDDGEDSSTDGEDPACDAFNCCSTPT